MLIFDDTGFASRATAPSASPGNTRHPRQPGNCQVTVNCHYAERTIAWPVATRLYLPESWPARCRPSAERPGYRRGGVS